MRNVKTRPLLVALLVFLFVVIVCVYLRSSGAVALLTLNRSAMIEVNGAPVPGEMLEGRLTAIVTMRDRSKSHSYRLFFEGDTDSTGDTGWVIDCHAWVAPRLPFLLEVGDYPPCNILSEDVYQDRRWPLFHRGRFIEFVTSDRSTIRIGQRNR
jgi:hypothetical protein